MDNNQKNEIFDIVADIRNKLGPFWTLSSLILSEHVDITSDIIKDVAKTSDIQKEEILKGLNRMVDIVNS